MDIFKSTKENNLTAKDERALPRKNKLINKGLPIVKKHRKTN